MERERNDLLEDVFPFLDSLARRVGLTWQAVDMRWGVSDDAVDEHDVVDICLLEVARCAAESAGPAFVLLGGDKYGFRPLPSRIPRGEFEALERSSEEAGAGKEEIALLRQWYKLDENARPGGEYVLLRISANLPDKRSDDPARRKQADAAWTEISTRLAGLLRRASSGLPEEARRKYTISVTEMEIERGLQELEGRYEGTFLFVRRRIDDIEEVARNGAFDDAVVRRFIDLENAPTPIAHGTGARPAAAVAVAAGSTSRAPVDAEAQAMLRDLLGRVSKHAPPVTLATKFSKPLSDEHVHAFSDAVCRMVGAGIVAAATGRAAGAGAGAGTGGAAADPLEAEAAQHLQTAWQCAEACLGQEAVVSELARYLEGASEGEGRPLALVGASGCGKSSIMGAVWRRVSSGDGRGDGGGAQPVVLGRFLGTTLHSGDTRSLLVSLARQLAAALGRPAPELPPDADFRTVAAVFLRCLEWGTREQPIYLILDALDQLSDELGRLLQWLPPALPAHCRCLVSILVGEAGGGVLERFNDHVENATVEAPAFDRSMAESVLGVWCQEAGRSLVPAQREAVLAAFDAGPDRTPLFLRLCWEQARRWRSFVEGDAAKIEAKDVPTLVEAMFKRLETKYGEALVRAMLGFVTVAKGGLSEAELADVLSCDDATLDQLFVWWTPPVRRVPPSLILRIRSDLGGLLAERGSGGASNAAVIGWYHRQFAEAATRRYVDADPDRRRAMHELLACYFGNEFAAGKRRHHMHRPPTSTSMEKLKGASISRDGAMLEDRRLAPQPLMLGDTPNVRRIRMQPAHLAASGQYAKLLDILRDGSLEFLFACARSDGLPALFTLLDEIMQEDAARDLREGFFEIKGFIGRHAEFMQSNPAPALASLQQRAANESDKFELATRAAEALRSSRATWLRCMNKPLSHEPCIMIILRALLPDKKFNWDLQPETCSLGVWKQQYIVIKCKDTEEVVCFDFNGQERWKANVKLSMYSSNTVHACLRISNDGKLEPSAPTSSRTMESCC
eukprot:tig00020675_g12610.t1